MLSPETTITFLTASVLLALVPGPDNLFVLMQSILHGRIAGMVVVLGLCTGLLVHTGAVVIGVAALVQASATAFSTLKFLGAGYLLYLAWRAFRAKAMNPFPGSKDQMNLGTLYRRGIIMNVTNPKVSVFFLAFLPQFADPTRGPVSRQLLLLGGLFLLATVLVFGSIANLAGTVSQWLRRSNRAQTVLHRIAAVVFVGLAVKLAMSD